MNSSESRGSFDEQSASFPGRPAPSRSVLRRVRSRAWRAATRARSLDALDHDRLGLGAVLFEPLVQRPVGGGLDEALDLGVAELGLGLALELRRLELDRDDRGQALAHVVAGEVLVLLLEQCVGPRIAVDRRGERRPEAFLVGAALMGVDGVGEGRDRVVVARVPLHRDLDVRGVALALEIDDRGVDRLLAGVEVRDEVADAALVVVGVGDGRVLALVGERDGQAGAEERHLPHALRQDLVAEIEFLEDLGVRPEGDGRAAALGLLQPLDRAGGHAADVGLAPAVAVPDHVGFELGGQGVHNRHADTVQSAGDCVGLAIELATGVQGRHHDLKGGPVLDRVLVDGDAATVVRYLHAAVREQRDVDPVTFAGKRLVDRVIHYLVHKVVEATQSG